MLRYALAIFIALLLFSALQPWLQRCGLGRLPGDIRVHLFGRSLVLPFTSTLLLSALLGLVIR